MKHAPSISETIRLCDERAATYGAMRATALTAVVLDLAIETLRHYEQPAPQRPGDAWLELEAFARLIERPPLDDVLLKQDAALRLAAAIRTLLVMRDVSPEHRTGSGSRPDATPLPDPAMPALQTAGAASPKPETECD